MSEYGTVALTNADKGSEMDSLCVELEKAFTARGWVWEVDDDGGYLIAYTATGVDGTSLKCLHCVSPRTAAGTVVSDVACIDPIYDESYWSVLSFVNLLNNRSDILRFRLQEDHHFPIVQAVALSQRELPVSVAAQLLDRPRGAMNALLPAIAAVRAGVEPTAVRDTLVGTALSSS